MSDAADIAARVREARRGWCELEDPPRRAVLVRRPTWEQRTRYTMAKDRVEQLHQVLALVDDWRGFTLADVLPGAAAEQLPFSRELWLLAVDESDDWIAKLLDHVARERAAADARMEAVSGN